MAVIGICLAAHDGRQQLQSQLECIVAQTFSDWHLYVSEHDWSNDARSVLEGFAACYPDRVTLVADDRSTVGDRGSICLLTGAVAEPYIAFLERGFVWRPDKLAQSLKGLRQSEAFYGQSQPIMVRVGCREVESDDYEICLYPRHMQQGKVGSQRSWRHPTPGVVVGSTMLINRPLLDRAHPFPVEAASFASWIELVANVFGIVTRLEASVVDIQKSGRGVRDGAFRRDPAIHRGEKGGWAVKQLQPTVEDQHHAEVAAFLRRYRDFLTPREIKRVKLFLSSPWRHPLLRMVAPIWAFTAPQGLTRVLGFALLSGRAAGRPVSTDRSWVPVPESN